ncbi:MAG: hypothetical protein JXJ19_04065 [Elusimicrobia bacterium]|nr:hypothetical protein [Elusimicrobiota bacterium]
MDYAGIETILLYYLGARLFIDIVPEYNRLKDTAYIGFGVLVSLVICSLLGGLSGVIITPALNILYVPVSAMISGIIVCRIFPGFKAMYRTFYFNCLACGIVLVSNHPGGVLAGILFDATEGLKFILVLAVLSGIYRKIYSGNKCGVFRGRPAVLILAGIVSILLSLLK